MSQYGWTHEHLLVVLPTTNFTTKVKAAQATATAYLPIHDISQSRPQEDLDLAVIPVSRQWSHNRMPYHEKTYSSTSPRISVLYPTLLGNRERTRVAGRISQTKGVRTCHNRGSRSSPGARQVRAHGALTFVADLSSPVRAHGALTFVADLSSPIGALRHPTCRGSLRPDLEAQAPVAVPAFYSTSVAGSASSPEARWSSSNRVDDPTNSGGPRAGHSSGASLGKPTWSSIFLATRLSVISAIAFIRAPARVQAIGGPQVRGEKGRHVAAGCSPAGTSRIRRKTGAEARLRPSPGAVARPQSRRRFYQKRARFRELVGAGEEAGRRSVER
jgi:hypothetical protein